MATATLLDAIYSWWVHPLVVSDGTRSWVGSVGRDGSNRVHRVDNDGGVASVALAGPFTPDEHNGVAFALNPDQQEMLAFDSRHNGDDHVRLQRVDRDTLAVSAQEQLHMGGSTVTYAQVMQRGSTVHIVARVDSASWWYRTSTDWGGTWSDPRVLADMTGLGLTYVVLRPDRVDADVWHMGVGPHPSNLTVRTLGHATVDLATGQIRATNGTILGSLDEVGGPAVVPGDLSTAVTLTGDERARTLDVGVQDGRPAIAYAVWEHPDNDLADYHVARWDGGTWVDTAWTLAAGAPFDPTERTYLGGATFGGDLELWTAREDSGTWSVERWTREAGTYVLAELVDSSATMLLRPELPPTPGVVTALYQRVTQWTSFNDYSGDLILLTATVPTPPAPGSGVAQRARATIRTRVTWLACDVVTGRKIAELPDARAEVQRVLSAYTSADVTVPLPTGGPGHLPIELLERATELGRAMLVLVVNDVPSWAGWVRDRVGGTDVEMHVPCVSLEGYLRARKVGAHTWVQQDVVSVIAAGLAGDAGDRAGVGSGIGLVIDAPPSGILRDRTYVPSDRETVYDALRELAGAGLIEFTVDLDWEDTQKQQVVEKVLRIRPRLGVASATPKARFSTLSAAEVRYRLREDHTDGRAGNYVVAYGPGEAEDQPASAPAVDQAALDAGAPIVEIHWQPSTSILDTATLDEHAARRLAEVRNGSRLWQLTARWDQYPRLNVDWAVGDDIGMDLRGHRHPGGVQAVARAVGWTLDTAAGLVTPHLLDPDSDPEAVTG